MSTLVRIPIFVFWALVAVPGAAGAVQAPEPHLISSARSAGIQAGLPALEGASVALGDIELRLWDGFGLAGIRGLILRRTMGRWQALRVDPTANSANRVVSLPDTGFWGERWKEAIAAGLHDVAPWADRTDGLVARDGYAVVLELNESGRYRAAGSVALDASCGTVGRRLLELAEILLREFHGCR